jgi:hypothetical protein
MNTTISPPIDYDGLRSRIDAEVRHREPYLSDRERGTKVERALANLVYRYELARRRSL